MSIFPLKQTSAHVKKYYDALAVSHKHGHTTEGNTRFAFEELLRRCASPYGWHVVPEYAFKGTDKQPLRADGALTNILFQSPATPSSIRQPHRLRRRHQVRALAGVAGVL